MTTTVRSWLIVKPASGAVALPVGWELRAARF
jgi:hypothetical protein